MAEHGADDLGLVLVALGEQRPDRPVDEARGERLLLAGPPFALEKPAGNLTRGEGLFLVIDRQREEIDAHSGLIVTHGGAEDDRVAIGDHDRAVGLAGDAPAFQDQAASAPVQLFTMNFKHDLSVLPALTGWLQPDPRKRRRECARRTSVWLASRSTGAGAPPLTSARLVSGIAPATSRCHHMCLESVHSLPGSRCMAVKATTLGPGVQSRPA